jgi:hypothetical protein
MRRRRLLIALGLVVLLLAGGAAGAYAFDSARSDQLAQGVRIAGIDVGGLNVNQARARLQAALEPRIERQVAAFYHGRSFVLTPRRANVHVDIAGMVGTALARSRSGNIVTRVYREVRGTPVDVRVRLRVVYDRPAVTAFARKVKHQLDQTPQSAEVKPSLTSVEIVPGRDGVAVRPRLFARALGKQLVHPRSLHALHVPVRLLKPEVSTKDLTRRYTWYISIDRAGFRLRVFHRLRLYKTYTIAVGRAGLETPAGLYEIFDKQVNPSWHVPNSDWAGDLAGRVIPPGPDDPIKARWMGFYNGAGIHGTDDISSLGTAASHGCIRMSIPDVIELYSFVPLHTPIYVA